LISGSGIFCGYWGDEEKTREVIKDGWLYTNDIFEGGEEESLKFIDRKQNVIITSEERKITPTHIENLIKSSPYISDVGIFTDRQNILSALIEIDFDTVAEWARRNNVLHAGFTGLVDRPEVYELIREEVREANQYLPEEEQIKKIRILPKQLNPGAGDITPTGKIKKGLFYERFRNLIEEPYRSEKEETSGNRSERE
jgi:long-chain acyl-CoA synthetase